MKIQTKKPHLSRPSSSKPICNKQNNRPFNTRGYYDPSQPYDQHYLQAKHKVFQKYRQQQDGYVMVDITNTRNPLIQRGCLKPISKQIQGQNKAYLDRATTSLVKQYFMRKQRKETRNNQKFADPPSIRAEILYPKVSHKSIGGSRMGSRVTKSVQLKGRNVTDDIL